MSIYSPASWATRRSHGFTIVEILVVVGIIALLAALLFPVLSRAREGARTKACASNLRQMGLAYSQYVNDSARRYPGAAQKQEWANGGHWVRGDQNYTDAEEALAKDGTPYTYNEGKRADVENGALFPYTKSAQIYICPSDPDGRNKNLSYSMNCAIAGMHNVRMSQPTEIILLVDEHTTNDGFFYTEGATSTDHLTSQHNGGGNLLFADGHVKYYSLEQYPLKDSALDATSIALKTRETGIPRFYDGSFGSDGFFTGVPAFGSCRTPNAP